MTLAAAAVAALSTLAPGSAEAAEYRGPQFALLAKQDVSVLRAQMAMLAGQIAVGAPLFSGDITARSTPGDFVLNDGRRTSGGLTRLGLSAFGGGGTFDTFAFFGGLALDQAYISKFPGLIIANDQVDARTIQGLLSVGLGAFGFVGAFGVAFGTEFSGLDPGGELVPKSQGNDPSFRTATPDEVLDASQSSRGDVGARALFFSVGHVEGITFATSFTDEPDTGEKTLSSFFIDVKPDRMMRRLGVYRFIQPRIGFAQYGGRVDPYVEITGKPLDGSPLREIPVGADDIFQTGLGFKVVTQIQPEATLRLAQLTWTYGSEQGAFPWGAGARGVVFRRADSYVFSTDLYVRLGYEWGGFAISYSYNSPDPVTFFSLPDSHVLGLQFYAGLSALVRPIVPIAPSRHLIDRLRDQVAAPDVTAEKKKVEVKEAQPDREPSPEDALDPAAPPPPDVRPAGKKKKAPPAIVTDSDRDGVPDEDDRCPEEPEDVDGFEDFDGCPDPDDDGDGVADLYDACPSQYGTQGNGCP